MDTRQRLLDAATEVFLEKGYEGTRVAEIARRAGLTTGAIYGNFDSKAGLLSAALASVVDAALAESAGDVARVVELLPAEHQPSETAVRAALELVALGSVVLRAVGREAQFPPDAGSLVAIAAAMTAKADA